MSGASVATSAMPFSKSTAIFRAAAPAPAAATAAMAKPALAALARSLKPFLLPRTALCVSSLALSSI